MRTGPSNPEGSNGELALYGFTSAYVYFVAPGCCSPIRRLTHAFVTLIVSSLDPGFSTLLTFTRKGVCHTTPRDFPLTSTSARFLTSPRSSQICAPGLNQLAGALMVFV